MNLPPDLALQISAFFIVFARVGSVLMMLPVFGEETIPSRVRLMIAFAMSVALYGLIGAPARAAVQGHIFLPAVLFAELLTGLALGTIVKILFFSISIAGGIVSAQAGLSSALISDPSQNAQTPIVARLMSIAAALVCMGMQVHHLWIGAIVHSYQSFPIGGLPPMADFAQLAIAATSRSMTLGISLAAPLLVYAIIFNVALGLAARVTPAIQVFFIAQPLNLLGGLTLATITVGTMITLFVQAMADAMQGGW